MTDDEGGHPTTPGTQGYPTGTEGYPVEPEGRLDRSGGPSGGSAEPRQQEDAWWRKLGFGSLQDYLHGLEAHQAELADRWFRRRPRRDPPAGSLPGAELADLPPRRRRAPVRQVGIKLRPAAYEALARAAFLYGVRPTTMARLLVNRGVRAVLESHADEAQRS